MRSLFALLLPRLIFCSDDKVNVCSICYEKMNLESNDSLTTQCGHDFHTECLATWKNTQNSCPLCRLQNPHRMSQNEKNEELQNSAHFGYLPKLKQMILQGADVNSRDDLDMTALMWAASKGRIDEIEMLLKNGADIEARDDHRNWTALMFATSKGNRAAVEVLLRNNASVDTKDYHKMTPLVKAVALGRVDIVEKLLRYGADTEARDDRNWTALNYAASIGGTFNFIQQYPRIVKLLLDKGANPRIEPEIYPKLTPEIKELIGSKIIVKSY